MSYEDEDDEDEMPYRPPYRPPMSRDFPYRPSRPRFGGFHLPQFEFGPPPEGLLAVGDMLLNGLLWSASIIGMLAIANKIMEAGMK